jgi:hypothetical protein
MRALLPTVLVAALVAPAAPAAADEEVVEVTPPAESPPSAPAPPFFSWHVFGFLRLKGGVILDDPNVAFVGRNDGFTLQNARIGILGSLGKRLAFVLSADGAVDERGGVNDTTGTLRFALKDAYLDVQVVRALSIRIVRFEPIFDLEEIIPYTERAFIDRSLESRGVVATQGYEVEGLSPGRSIGVALRAEKLAALGPAALGYELAVQNGNGEYESQNDNNSLAYSGALFVTFGRSIVFAAGRQKDRTVGELPFRQTEKDLGGSAGFLLRVGPIEAGAQAMLRHTTFPTTGGAAENASGGHAQIALALWLFNRKATLSPGYRFATYNPSDLIAVDRVQEHTIGLTLKLMPVPLRVQFNYTHAVEQAQRTLDNDRFEAGFEVAL